MSERKRLLAKMRIFSQPQDSQIGAGSDEQTAGWAERLEQLPSARLRMRDVLERQQFANCHASEMPRLWVEFVDPGDFAWKTSKEHRTGPKLQGHSAFTYRQIAPAHVDRSPPT